MTRSSFNYSPWAIRTLLTVVSVMCLTSLLSAQDTITLERRGRGGSKLLGTITASSTTELTIKVDGEERKVPANQIQRVNLSDETNELRQARSAVTSGQWEQARDALQRVELKADARDVLRQELGYYRAIVPAQMALQQGGDPREAMSKLRDFLRTERNSFHFYSAVELLGQVAEAAGAHEDAVKFYQQLRKAPWPEYELRTQVLLGRALRSQGKFAEAVAQYEQSLKTPGTDPQAIRQQTLARLGRAACWTELGQLDEALKEVDEIIAKNDPEDQELFAQAYLVLGAIHDRAKRPVDAVLAYLHIDLLFYSQRDAHAQALYHLTQLWPQLEQPERAVEARKILNSRYPGTAWSQKAG